MICAGMDARTRVRYARTARRAVLRRAFSPPPRRESRGVHYPGSRGSCGSDTLDCSRGLAPQDPREVPGCSSCPRSEPFK